MAEISWIKIQVDIFNNRKIKQLRQLPEGDSIVLVWLQLLCLAGHVNDGGRIYFLEGTPYTPEMLAVELGAPPALIEKSISYFERFGMLELVDGVLTISNWWKYQSVERMEGIKASHRENQRRYYYRELLREAGFDVDAGDFTSDVDELKKLHSDYKNSLTSEHDKPDIRLISAPDKPDALDKSKSKSKKDLKNIMSSNSADSREIVSYLNSQTGKRYRASTQATQTLINARLNEGFTVDDFKTVIDTKVSQWSRDAKMSAFLRPQTLFGTKFESYLNERGGTRDGQPDFSAYR